MSNFLSAFSGAVKLQDLSDFIAPSQACVVKLDGGKKLALQADDVGEARFSMALHPAVSSRHPTSPLC